MNTTIQQALGETLDYLTTLNREQIRPKEAQARLRPLQQRYPNLVLDLVWEEETFDHSLHYDVLVRLAGTGTVSLGLAPELTLPWPLRGVQRWRDVDLVRVNNIVLDVAQAVAYLDSIWDETQIIDRMIHTCLIQEALNRDPIELSDAELQRAMDGFRRARKLYTPEDTFRWMEQHGMSHTQLERYVTDEALIVKLRERVTAGQIEPFFARHQADFDTAQVARITFADADAAQRAGEQIRAGELDFYAVAQQQFLTTPRDNSAAPQLFATIQRGQAAAELAPVFAAAPGDLVGPIATAEGYTLVRVLAVTSAQLDAPTRQAIQKILFENWLAERRRTARIEWYWGTAEQTARAA